MTPPTENLTTLIDVAHWCHARGLPASIVGRWVWIKFPEKPDAEVRAELKAVGFRWVKRHGEWAHNCGPPTGSGRCNFRWKYGELPVSAVSELESETAA
jgi:hypothetical protein